MKMLVQRVKHAKVTVDGNVTGAIEQGYLVLLGVAPEDTTEIMEKMVDKLLRLRIFSDENDVNIGVLTVPINIAQEITDKMVDGGIKAVWNFTPFRIRVPENIVVQNTSLYAHLAVMFNRLNFNEK